jgi:uncharacterized membrane protein YqiK
MRADAYKQFNEAAIIQTVLSALPDIVRAAAEPMGHIDSLTVMSADGASDIVKNATRAMIESTTAIKGLTGLDVPNLIGGALGRGFGERLRTGEGNSESDAKSAADRISEIAGAGLSTMKAQAAAAAAASKAAAEQASAKVEAAAAQAPGKVEAAAEKVAPAVEKAADKPWAVIPESKPGAAAAKVVPNDGNVSQWAKWLADQLRRIPDIQVYGTLTLNQLVDHGPASARAVWATAQSVLGKDYGSLTVTDLLKRFAP